MAFLCIPLTSDNLCCRPFKDGGPVLFRIWCGFVVFPRTIYYGVYISQFIRFARVSSHVADFYTINHILTAKLLKQGYRYHKLRKTFSTSL